MKRKNIKCIVYLFIGITILNIGCKKDWFDEKSDKSLAVPATLQDFEYLLDEAAVMIMVSPGLGEIASDGHYMPETRWQTLSTVGNDNPTQKNAYTWSNTFLYREVRDWNYNYKKIFQCNLVIDGLKKLNPNIESQRFNKVKGNALFHRANCFYELAQVYAQPYKESSAGTDLGIPVKEGIDITENAKRATVKQTYEKIITDVKEAAELLPMKPQYLTRGSRLACYGLLSRIYLAMGNFEQAGFYADLALKMQNDLIDFSTIPATNTNMGLFNKEVLFHSLIVNYNFVFQTGYIFIDQSLYDLYDANDLRKTRFFNPTANGILFKGMYNANILLFSGTAVDEMYLIRAESNARAGNVSVAMRDLNDLLRSRWAKNPDNSTKYIDQTATNALSALNIILLERRKELLLRGLRWTDLRRLNQEDRFKITLTRNIGGKTFTLEPNSFQYTFPIPDDEMGLSKMPQSPGWNR